jgi:phosphoribosylformylglycinamidine synthase
MARTLRLISGHEPAMVWHTDTDLPVRHRSGGNSRRFSYGDYLRCGAIAARSPIMDAVRGYAAHGRFGAGRVQWVPDRLARLVCCRSPDAQRNLRFICRDVYLRVERSDTPFTRGYNAGQVVRVPVAHAKATISPTVKRSHGSKVRGRVLFRYSSPDGMIDPNWNHNGGHQRDRRHPERARQCARYDAAS